MKKRLIVSLLAISLALFVLGGCQNFPVPTNDPVVPQGGTSQPAEVSVAPETGSSKYQTTYGSKKFDNVKIKVELFDRSNAPEGSTITDNKWTKYINEQMNKVGITVEFVPVPRWDEVPKMQTMMASGTAPDLTLTYTYAHAEDYFNQGGVWELSEFIDAPDQALNMKAYLGTDVMNIGRKPDGQLYGIVAKRATTAKSNFFIRKDWLDKLGLQIPKTTDELYDVIYKMVKNNPDGKTDAIGINLWNMWNMKMAFSHIAGDPVKAAIANSQTDRDDSYGDYYDPGNREFYRFLNKAYNDGLMHKEYYTLSEDNFKSYIVSGTLGFFEYSVNGSVDVLRGSLLKTLQENQPGADIVSIPAFYNAKDGKQYSAAYALGGLINFCPLTADAETVEACMTYLDWQCTKEGGFVLYHGFEGVNFNFDKGVPVVKDAAFNSKDKDWLRTDIFLVGNQGYFATVNDFNACTSKEAPGYEQHVIDNYVNALSGKIVNDTTYTSPSTPDLITDIGIVRDEYTVQCVTCPVADFDATYDKYMSELEKVGIKTIIEERTKYFTELYGN